jgi:hypothetical protein
VHLLNHEGRSDEARESSLEHLRAHMRWDDRSAQRAVRWAVTRDLVDRTDGRLQLTAYGRETARQVMVR